MMMSLYSTRVSAPAQVPASDAFDDVLPLNLPRRGNADVADSGGAEINTYFSGLLRPKKTISVSTFNVRTLSGDRKINELIAGAEQHHIDVICIQEHRHFHDNIDIRYSDMGSWTLITASETKNSVNATVGGVGFLINSRAKASLNYVSKVSSRIVAATFNSNPSLTLVSCYRPTNCSDVEVVEDFYDDLSETIKHTPKQEERIERVARGDKT